VSSLHDLSTAARLGDQGAAEAFVGSLRLLGVNPQGFRKDAIQRTIARAFASVDELDARIEALLAARTEARKAKDFARADAIRKALDAAGVVVMDRTGGPTEWELGPNFDPARLADIDA
jgi:cysteinyl-tRNA synthetase